MSLQPLFKPRSVAVVGASRDPSSIGATVFDNLVRGRFAGPVYPVNPNAGHVGSVHAYHHVDDIPGPVDLAVILVPAAYVAEVVEACGTKGVGAVIVISAGFAETGPEGRARQRALTRRVRELGMRMVGPNCLGVLSTDPEVRLNATFAPSTPPSGNVAFSSQSGALGVAIIDMARELAIGVSEFVSIGNRADVSSNDLLEHWERDPRTDLILLYLESFGNPRRFARIARRVSRNKPILVVKSGRTRAGAAAAASHTGSLATSDRAVGALVDYTGIIRVDSVRELFDCALLLANQPLPGGPRVAIVTNAGGPGILATDACAGEGLKMAALSAQTLNRLRHTLPAEASVANPVDMIASAGPEQMGECLRALLEDEGVDAVMALFVPPGQADTDGVAQAIVAASDVHPDKPVLTCFMGAHGVPAALRSLREGHVPSYAFPESAARALARAAEYAVWKQRPEGAAPRVEDVDEDAAKAALAQAQPDGWLPSSAADGLLRAYGLPVVQSTLLRTAAEAHEAAARAKGPLVLKAVAEGLVHKSDQGGVLLGLADAAAVTRGFSSLQQRFGTAFKGAIAQPMVASKLEVIIGAARDPSVGPLLMFGMGGVFVELLEDVTFSLAPLTDADAKRIVRSVRAAKLLEGYRGQPAGDVEALEALLIRVGQLVVDHPEISELDLNPVKVLPEGEGVTIVDARVRVAVRSER